MNIKTLSKAIAEAERFLAKAKEMRDDPYHVNWFGGSALTGATRRASMDLTRALADLRRPS